MNLFKKKMFWSLLVIVALAFIIIKNNMNQFQFITDLFENKEVDDLDEFFNGKPDPEEFGSEEYPSPAQKKESVKTPLLEKMDSLEKPTQKMDNEIQKFEPVEEVEKIVETEKTGKKEKPYFKYITPKIICPLETDPLLYVVLKVQINYSEKNLKKEIKFRELDIKGIIQNIVYKSDREDLKADNLRNKIKISLSKLLQNGTLQDVIFKDFKIEIRRK